MSPAELYSLLQSNDRSASKVAFDMYFGKLSPIARRYAKSAEQADDLFNQAFHSSLNKLRSLKQCPSDPDAFIQEEFIREAISFIKSIRSEYFVSSTVYAPGETKTKNYDLFDTNDLVDFQEIDNEILVRSIQQLVPSQRLVFNLHVIEGHSLPETAAMLEASEGTVKSNLEKARFNLQKNIEKTLKSTRI